MELQNALVDGGTTALSLYIIWQLIKDKDKVIRDNTEALGGVRNILERQASMLQTLIERSDKELAAHLKEKEQDIIRKQLEKELKDRNGN